MTYEIRKFEDLVAALAEAVKEVRLKHNVTKVEKLSAERKGQIEFLETAVKGLQSPTNKAAAENKAQALTGLLLGMFAQLEGEYWVKSRVTNSILAQGVLDTMGVKAIGQIDVSNRLICLEAAALLLRNALFEKNAAGKCDLTKQRSTHAFSAITDFDTVAFYKGYTKLTAPVADDAISVSQKAVLDEKAKAAAEAAAKKAADAPGFFSRWMGGAKSTQPSAEPASPAP